MFDREQDPAGSLHPEGHAGIRQAADTTRLLADLQHGQIPPGSLILADEASMISLTHLAAITC